MLNRIFLSAILFALSFSNILLSQDISFKVTGISGVAFIEKPDINKSLRAFRGSEVHKEYRLRTSADSQVDLTLSRRGDKIGSIVVPQNTIILVNDASTLTSNDANLIYLDKSSSDATSLNYYVANGFDNSRWNTSAEINGGYPYLLRDDGSDFVRVVPNSISINARTFDTFTDNRLNSILNVPSADGTTDTKKIILFYDSSNPTYNLNDLFAFSSDPNLNVNDVRMQINCSNT